jgi:hypothetical protein
MQAPEGRKFDAGKLRWDLLPWREVREVVDVLTQGAAKYEPNNWQVVPDARNRYFAAAQRHILAWWGGEERDPEMHTHHLANAVCCLLFLMWFDLNHARLAATRPTREGA